jgi:hypothetical protein
MIAALLSSLPGFAGDFGLNVNVRGDEPITSCSQLRVSSNDGEVAVGEDHLTFAQPASTVRVEAAQNGGIYVYGWDRPEFGVLNCKAAAAEDSAAARRAVDEIKVSFDSGALAVSGPGGNDWTAYLIIHAPRASSLSLTGVNGPISLADLSGKVDVKNTNGPLAIKDSAGQIEAHVQNGPIDYSGNAGDIHLQTQNGPLSIRLAGSSWNGKGLEAESTNGPLALNLPDHYNSGVLVKTRGYSPFHCSGCAGARKDFDDNNKTVQFGTGEPVIRMSTVNGPVSIRSNGHEIE